MHCLNMRFNGSAIRLPHEQGLFRDRIVVDAAQCLPLGDDEFDTAILDDVLFDADRPADAIAEAVRVLRPGGRLLLLSATGQRQFGEHAARLANWCAGNALRLGRARPIPAKEPEWLLAVATKHDAATAAA